MNKIRTLFKRNEGNLRYVTGEVAAGCEWVLAGEGIATRKYDGTCVMFDGERWWARRETKPGRDQPAGFVELERDATTGKRVGWEPIEQSSFARWHAEALSDALAIPVDQTWLTGTYELVGPKINGNPERFDTHRLIPHAEAERVGDPSEEPPPYTAEECFSVVLWIAERGGEGIVWHHPDGRMAKLKRQDLPP